MICERDAAVAAKAVEVAAEMGRIGPAAIYVEGLEWVRPETHKVCRGCARWTANKGGVCTPCLDMGRITS